MIKNVLVSHNSIPTETIGSWKRMLTYLDRSNGSIFDYIICPIENKYFLTEKHFNVKYSKHNKYLGRIFKDYKFRGYLGPIKKLIKSEKKLIITVIDNYPLLIAINHTLTTLKKRKNVKLIFLQHGHNYYLSPQKKQSFFSAIDLLIVLTKASYEEQLRNVHAIPCRIKQLYNGVDSDLFKTVSSIERNKIREQMGYDKKKRYFLWLSQDREKKGLNIILKTWKKFVAEKDNVELLVIGTKNKYKSKQVTSLGIIPNKDLAKYYQLSDFYVFSSLCYEGHSLSLTEAMKCGCYCIASNIGSNSEILGQGKYGHLVNNPNFEESWIQALSDALERYAVNDDKNPYIDVMPKNIYDLEDWRMKISAILNEEKKDFI